MLKFLGELCLQWDTGKRLRLTSRTDSFTFSLQFTEISDRRSAWMTALYKTQDEALEHLRF